MARAQARRHAVGTGVAGGMLAATFLALFFIPLFFHWVLDKRLQARPEEIDVHPHAAEHASVHTPSHHPSPVRPPDSQPASPPGAPCSTRPPPSAPDLPIVAVGGKVHQVSGCGGGDLVAIPLHSAALRRGSSMPKS